MPNTYSSYGTSQCARNLADMLEKAGNRTYTRKVARFLSHHAELNKSLLDIRNPSHRSAFATMLKHDIKRSSMILPQAIKTHAINVAVGNLRDTIRRYEGEAGVHLSHTAEFDFT